MKSFVALIHVLSNLLALCKLFGVEFVLTHLAGEPLSFKRPAANSAEFIRKAKVVAFARPPPLGFHVCL